MLRGTNGTHSSSASVNKSRLATAAGGALCGNRLLLKRGQNRSIATAMSLGTIAKVCFLALSTSAAAIVFFRRGDEERALIRSHVDFEPSLTCSRTEKSGINECSDASSWECCFLVSTTALNHRLRTIRNYSGMMAVAKDAITL